MFRLKRGIKADYNRQGYIYFLSLQYRKLPKESREKIRRLCREAGGEHHRALLEFVTTETSATAVCMKYYIGKSTLYRIVKKYYEAFPDAL